MYLRSTAFDLGNELGRIGGERVGPDNHRSFAGQLGDRLRELRATRHPSTLDQNRNDQHPPAKRRHQLFADSVATAIQPPLPRDVSPASADDGDNNVCRKKGTLRLGGGGVANDLELLAKPVGDPLGDLLAVLAPITQIDPPHATSLHPDRAVGCAARRAYRERRLTSTTDAITPTIVKAPPPISVQRAPKTSPIQPSKGAPIGVPPSSSIM
jgi:hypothetical protein